MKGNTGPHLDPKTAAYQKLQKDLNSTKKEYFMDKVQILEATILAYENIIAMKDRHIKTQAEIIDLYRSYTERIKDDKQTND